MDPNPNAPAAIDIEKTQKMLKKT